LCLFICLNCICQLCPLEYCSKHMFVCNFCTYEY
ncbi:hypothetical protein FVEG_08512, partial [Fusarium verticillioides 7600]